MGYSFLLTARDLSYALSHRQHNTYYYLWNTGNRQWLEWEKVYVRSAKWFDSVIQAPQASALPKNDDMHLHIPTVKVPTVTLCVIHILHYTTIKDYFWTSPNDYGGVEGVGNEISERSGYCVNQTEL